MELLEKTTEKLSGTGVKVDSVSEAQRITREGDSMKLQNNLVRINFSETPSFVDPNMSTGCVVVLVSDGETGVISHLQTDANVAEIAESIFDIYEVPPTICLSGGSDGISGRLLGNIFKEFGDRGFVVSQLPENNDIGGVWKSRQAVLFSDRVVVRYPYQNSQESRSLAFPS